MAQFIEVVDPAGPDVDGDQFSQGRVAEREEAARGDPIGHVGEFFRREIIEVAQHTGLQQIAVELRDAVDRVASHTGKMSHPHGAVTVLIDQ